MSNNFDLPVSYGSVWIPLEDDDYTPKTENLIEDLEAMSTAEEPLYSSREGESFAVRDIVFDDGSIEMMVQAAELSISISMPVTPSRDFLRFIDQINESLGRDLETRAKEYKSDDRGRISIGSEYANQDVKVIVLDG